MIVSVFEGLILVVFRKSKNPISTMLPINDMNSKM